MARNKRRRIQPAELTMNFALTEAGTHYISIPAVMSILNRKLYRSCRDYMVADVRLYSQTSGSVPNCKITILPSNWPTRNGLVKAYHLWRNMNKKVLDDNPSLQGTWADFKPAFDADHTTYWDPAQGGNGIGTLRPIDSGGIAYQPGEWDQAEITYPQHHVDIATGAPLPAVNNFLHILGPDVGGQDSVGIVQGYQDTRATVQAEDPADDPVDANNWMITLFDEGSSDPELAAQVIEENDRPPYDQDMYPGADTNGIAGVFKGYLACNFDVATGATKTQDAISGFIAPLGLIKIETTAVSGTEFLQINLVPGPYNGCMSESIV